MAARSTLSHTPGSKWLVVLLLSSGLAVDYCSRLALFSVVPLWSKDLVAGDVAVGLVASSFLWTYGALSPVAGYLGDRFSRRTVVIASLAAWSAITLVSALVGSVGQLVALRILVAMAQVCFMPVGQALITDFHGPDTSGRASGYFQAGASIGVFLSGFPMAWLATRAGWRGMLVVIGGLGIIFALVLARWLPHAPVAPKSAPARRAKPVSIRESAAVLWIPSFLALIVVFSMASVANWVLFTYLPLFVYDHYHLGIETAAFQATFYIQLADVLLIPVYATAVDRWTRKDRRNRYLAFALASALGLPALAGVGAGRHTAVLTGGLILFGLVMASADASWLSLICSIIPPRRRASAFGLLNFSGTLMAGVAVMLTALLMRRVGLGAIIASLGLMYLAIATLLLICGYWLLKRDSKNIEATAPPFDVDY